MTVATEVTRCESVSRVAHATSVWQDWLEAVGVSPIRGASELLFSQPVPRGATLVGRVAGLGLALTGAQALGFGVARLAVYWQTGPCGLDAFVAVIATAVTLTAVFLSVATWLAHTQARHRARVLAVAVVVWVLRRATLFSVGRRESAVVDAAVSGATRCGAGQSGA